MEILVVLGIFIVISAFGLFMSMDIYRGNSLHAEKNLVISVLQKARSRAMNNINEHRHGVDFTNADKYVIYGLDASDTVVYTEEIEVSTKVGDGDSLEIVFDQLTGNPTCTPSPCSLTLTGDGQSFTVTINSEGRITWN